MRLERMAKQVDTSSGVDVGVEKNWDWDQTLHTRGQGSRGGNNKRETKSAWS
jgi:hypothetical protein